MLLVWIGTLFIWIAALLVWITVSPFIHELSHMVTAYVCGFKVKEFRLISIPGGVRGYVDVVVNRNKRHYRLKRGIMHLSGLVAHLFFAGIAVFLFISSRETLLKGIWLLGIVTNLYLVVMNIFPEDSDGRQFWHMMKEIGR